MRNDRLGDPRYDGGAGVMPPEHGPEPDEAIRAIVTRLSRPHASGGDVIERAAIVAEGADATAIVQWILAHAGPAWRAHDRRPRLRRRAAAPLRPACRRAELKRLPGRLGAARGLVPRVLVGARVLALECLSDLAPKPVAGYGPLGGIALRSDSPLVLHLLAELVGIHGRLPSRSSEARWRSQI